MRKKVQYVVQKWERDIWKQVIDKTDVQSDEAVRTTFSRIPDDATLLRYMRDSVIERGWVRDPKHDDATDKKC